MTRLRTILTLAFWTLAFPGVLLAQQMEWEIQSLRGEEGNVEYDFATHLFTASGGVLVKYGGGVLTADRVTVNEETGDVVADGGARIERDAQVWVSEHLRYNFKTKQIEAEQFRTGQAPLFVAGEGLHADTTNNVYGTTNAFVTTDDLAEPAVKIKAKYIRLIPNDRVEAHQATLYVKGVPVFYLPYYSRKIGPRSNNFNFIPGYRSRFGPFVLGSYRWFLSEELDGTLHTDYRVLRGPGVGPDVNYHLGRWGEGTASYYYVHDQDPNKNASLGADIPADRQRVHFSYLATPWTNVSVRSMVRYQTDTNFIRDFFEPEYRQNPQPSTFVEVNKFWQNFSLDAYAQPRVNDFFETVERLPDIRLTGYRQQLGPTPLYYESESSAGYYQRLFAETNSSIIEPNYAAARADSFHQLLLPHTFFGWLNVTPRAGGRVTYYSEASGPGATTEELYRGVFNTGAEATFKASQVWPGVQNRLFEVDGLRHIIQPAVNYVYVPAPNYETNQLPQFDYVLPSLRLLPIDFPDFNDIDSIDSENVIRWGLNNRFQTKRDGKTINLAMWDVYTDWRLRPRSYQTTFSDIFSDLAVRPRSWLTLESLTRFDVADNQWNMAFHTLTIQPNDIWSWTLGHLYLSDQLGGGPDQGNSLFTSAFTYRLNEDWAVRAAHRFEAADGVLEEQAYTVYRDLRSWTAGLTFRVLDNRTGPTDYTVAFTFSLKTFPRYGLGATTAQPSYLLGY